MGHGKKVWIFLLGMLFLLAPLALSAGAKPTRTMVPWNGRKLVVYDHQRLVFYDGPGEDARAIAEAPCKDMEIWVKPSIQGKYVAVFVGYIMDKGVVRVYDSEGKEISSLHLDDWWMVRAVSDTGPLFYLVKRSASEFYPFVRIVDRTGKIVYDFTRPWGEGGGLAGFAWDGTTYVWGSYVEEQTGERRGFVLLLDAEGKVKWEREFEPGMRIHHVNVSPHANRIVLAVGPRARGELRPKSMLVYDIRTGSSRSLPVPAEYEGVIKSEVAISPDGRLGVVRVGAKRIILFDLEHAKFVFDREFEALPSGRRLKRVMEALVDNEGNVVVAGVLEGKEAPVYDYAIGRFDANGNMIAVRVYQELRSRLYIKQIFDGRIAILLEWGNIIDLW